MTTRNDTIEQCAEALDLAASCEGNDDTAYTIRRCAKTVRELKVPAPASDPARGGEAQLSSVIEEFRDHHLPCTVQAREAFDKIAAAALASPQAVEGWPDKDRIIELEKRLDEQVSRADRCDEWAQTEAAKCVALGKEIAELRASPPSQPVHTERNRIIGIIKSFESRRCAQGKLLTLSRDERWLIEDILTAIEGGDVSERSYDPNKSSDTSPGVTAGAIQPVHTAVTEAMVEARDPATLKFCANLARTKFGSWEYERQACGEAIADEIESCVRAALSAAAQQKGGDADETGRLSELDKTSPGVTAGAPQPVHTAVTQALRELVYVATHLSPQEADGSHKCRIGKETLERARAALSAAAQQKGGDADEK